MKKLFVLLLIFCFGIPILHAQSSMIPEATFRGDRIFTPVNPTLNPDPYPLIGPYPFGKMNGSQLLQLKEYQGSGFPVPAINDEIDPGMIFQFNFPNNIDPGILLKPKYWNCDPGIVFNPNKIPSFHAFDPLELLIPDGANSFVLPFQSPFSDPLQKYQELQIPQKLDIR